MVHTLAMETALGPHTWEEFISLDEDDLRELIDGELVEVEVPNAAHEHAVIKLGQYLGIWADEHDGTRVFASAYKIRIGPKHGVMPDVQLYLPSNKARPQDEDGLMSGRPDLVVEIISPSSRRYDRVIKLGYYLKIRVPEYWIVDPEDRTIEQLILRKGRYAIEQTATGKQHFRPGTFEGLDIPLAKLWL
jgi:Uma2 family endonuclease